MNASKFTWEKYCSNVGFSLCECWDMNTNRPQSGFVELGRCYATELIVRPRTEGYGVMLMHEESGDEFWLHALTDKTMGVLPLD